MSGQLGESVDAFLDALALSPESAAILTHLGTAMAEMGESLHLLVNVIH